MLSWSFSTVELILSTSNFLTQLKVSQSSSKWLMHLQVMNQRQLKGDRLLEEVVGTENANLENKNYFHNFKTP